MMLCRLMKWQYSTQKEIINMSETTETTETPASEPVVAPVDAPVMDAAAPVEAPQTEPDPVEAFKAELRAALQSVQTRAADAKRTNLLPDLADAVHELAAILRRMVG